MRSIIAAIAALILLTYSAEAQNLLKRNENPANRPIGAAIDAVGEKVEAKVFAALAEPFQKLAEFIGSDLDEAARLSVAIPGLQDTNGQACWIAMGDFGKIVKEHPVPLTFKAATDIQALRLLVLKSNQLCSNPACTIVFADLANVAQTAAPIPLPIPALSQICSKIGQLAPMLPAAALPVVPAKAP